jgi:hypothetical protein
MKAKERGWRRRAAAADVALADSMVDLELP